MSQQLYELETEQAKFSSYETPRLIVLGSVMANTLGQNGSSNDGGNSCTQTGGGSDCNEPHSDPCCPR